MKRSVFVLPSYYFTYGASCYRILRSSIEQKRYRAWLLFITATCYVAMKNKDVIIIDVDYSWPASFDYMLS